MKVRVAEMKTKTQFSTFYHHHIMTSRGQEGREDALVMMVVCAEWSEGWLDLVMDFL